MKVDHSCARDLLLIYHVYTYDLPRLDPSTTFIPMIYFLVERLLSAERNISGFSTPGNVDTYDLPPQFNVDTYDLPTPQNL